MCSQMMRTLQLRSVAPVGWVGPLSSGATGATAKWLVADVRKTLWVVGKEDVL